MTRMINYAYLLIGGNMGDRLAQLATAHKEIGRRCGPIVKCSAVYETAAWGLPDQPAFLNQVLLVQTSFTATGLLNTTLTIEESMGRKRLEKYGPRLMDIDILLFNNDVVDTTELQVPHPRMAERRFVLVPLAEIAGDYVHPLAKITIQAMLDQCTDALDVHKL